jgi:pyruvate dehydrogenase E2 component (dihydrolipoamide acetyltransferase)
MKNFFAALMLVLLVSPVFADDAAPAAAAPAAAAPAAAPAAPKAKKAGMGDEAGIKKTFSEVSDAWAAGDAAAIASHLTKEASIINPFGQDAWNRDDAQKVIAADLDMMKGSTQTFDDFKFHSVLPGGFALVDATGTVSGLKNTDGSAAPDTQFHIYAAMANRGGKWFVLALRPYAFVKTGNAAAMAPAAPAAAAAAPIAPAPAAAPPDAGVPAAPSTK